MNVFPVHKHASTHEVKEATDLRVSFCLAEGAPFYV
jgi:hypothetical protein